MDEMAKFEHLFKDIAALRRRLAELDMQYGKELSGLEQRFAPLRAELKESLKDKEKELLSLARRHRRELFADKDMAEFKAGVLILRISYPVKKSRGVLDALERMGWKEAIKIKRTVDWDVIEGWPQERLAAIGTERKRKEVIEYVIR